MKEAEMLIFSHHITMYKTGEDAASSGKIHRETSNFPIALQYNILYEELKGKMKWYTWMHKHANAGEKTETPFDNGLHYYIYVIFQCLKWKETLASFITSLGYLQWKLHAPMSSRHVDMSSVQWIDI